MARKKKVKLATCPRCRGRRRLGLRIGHLGDRMIDCHVCDGTGKVQIAHVVRKRRRKEAAPVQATLF